MTTDPATIISIRDLTHHYGPNHPPAVDGLSFTIPAGQIVGLLGPNGAGKTTTLHAVLGLLQPSSGTVEVFGRSPIRHRLEVLPRLNFASANVDLPSNLRVEEVLRIFARLYGVHRNRGRLEDLLERFELLRFRDHKIGSLSSGEQTRVKLCKALLNAPDLLILDEPTLSLDPYMAQKVRVLLRDIQRERGMAVLYTSHNMQEVERFCDRIIFLSHGRLLADGTPAEILRRLNTQTLEELFIRASESGELFNAAA